MAVAGLSPVSIANSLVRYEWGRRLVRFSRSDDGGVQAVGDGVAAGEGDLGESCISKLAGVFSGGQCACDAVGVGAETEAVLGGEVIVGDQVADADAAAGCEDAVDFAEYAGFVRGEVDDAVGDDDVDAGVG